MNRGPSSATCLHHLLDHFVRGGQHRWGDLQPRRPWDHQPIAATIASSVKWQPRSTRIGRSCSAHCPPGSTVATIRISSQIHDFGIVKASTGMSFFSKAYLIGQEPVFVKDIAAAAWEDEARVAKQAALAPRHLHIARALRHDLRDGEERSTRCDRPTPVKRFESFRLPRKRTYDLSVQEDLGLL